MLQVSSTQCFIHALPSGLYPLGMQIHSSTLLADRDPFVSCTVHVTSYLNFSAEIRGLPSRNSVNVCKISAGRPHPLCKLAAGTYQLQNTFLGIRLSRIGGEIVSTLLVKAP